MTLHRASQRVSGLPREGRIRWGVMSKATSFPISAMHLPPVFSCPCESHCFSKPFAVELSAAWSEKNPFRRPSAISTCQNAINVVHLIKDYRA